MRYPSFLVLTALLAGCGAGTAPSGVPSRPAAVRVTAIWITSPVDQIDGFVTGAGFPDWGYHGYWADDFTRIADRLDPHVLALVKDAEDVPPDPPQAHQTDPGGHS